MSMVWLYHCFHSFQETCFYFFKEICRNIFSQLLFTIQVNPNTFLTATSFQLIVLKCLLTVEGWTETPVDFFTYESRVETDFSLSIKDDSFQHCLASLNHAFNMWW
ncbi:hypothetical protein MHYP_G00164850 [Metynnis hypsauchen]